MRRTLTISLLLLVLGGCATPVIYDRYILQPSDSANSSSSIGFGPFKEALESLSQSYKIGQIEQGRVLIEVKYSSLFAVIDKLQDAGILGGYKSEKRTLGFQPNRTSDFIATQQALDFAYALGIHNKSVKVLDSFHVRLRDSRKQLLQFKQNPYTKDTEMMMSQYNHYLNQQSIILKTDDEADEGIVEYGTKLGGQKIHLYRNYKNWSEIEAVEEDFESLRPLMKLSNPDLFSLIYVI